jgi:hypothetical protein
MADGRTYSIVRDRAGFARSGLHAPPLVSCQQIFKLAKLTTRAQFCAVFHVEESAESRFDQNPASVVPDLSRASDAHEKRDSLSHVEII